MVLKLIIPNRYTTHTFCVMKLKSVVFLKNGFEQMYYFMRKKLAKNGV